MRVFVAGATRAIGRARPDVIVHQLTALAGVMRYSERAAAPTNRLRSEGTDYLLSAGQAVGVRRFVGETGVVIMTEIRDASNEKAKRELGWHPAHPSSRERFVAA